MAPREELLAQWCGGKTCFSRSSSVEDCGVWIDWGDCELGALSDVVGGDGWIRLLAIARSPA